MATWRCWQAAVVACGLCMAYLLLSTYAGQRAPEPALLSLQALQALNTLARANVTLWRAVGVRIRGALAPAGGTSPGAAVDAGAEAERRRKWTAPAINRALVDRLEHDRRHPVKEYEVYNSTARITYSAPHNHGVGNAMMAYATLYGLSRLHRLDPFVETARRSVLYDWFELSAPLLDKRPETFKRPLPLSERFCCKADGKFLQPRNGTDIVLNGYLQTYKHFERAVDELRRREFRFRPHILSECQQRLRNSIAATLPADNSLTMSDCTYVGVHCRRGDFANAGKYAFGHQAALASYLRNAVRYFREKLSNATCIRFVVLGNDAQWNREAMDGESTNDTDIVILQPHKSAIIDMCILAQCNHTIGTTGTFSWFAGFLSAGHVTYQRPWARPGSPLEKQYAQADFFLPHWVPVDA